MAAETKIVIILLMVALMIVPAVVVARARVRRALRETRRDEGGERL